jgi:GGDEF domain-containing protein
MVIALVVGQRLHWDGLWVQSMLLVVGPSMVGVLLMRLLKKRSNGIIDKALIVFTALADLGLLGFFLAGALGLIAAGNLHKLITPLCFIWASVLSADLVYRAIQNIDTGTPWTWWLMLGHALGLAVAVLFLTDIADALQSYWPVVLMLLAQVPSIYLSLVWRSRLLNEARLRSSAAGVVDPLTGLVTTPVLIERLLRIMARAQQGKTGQTSSALYLIEVQNWAGLLADLGADANEKMLLEAAMRLRRSVGDNDMVARIAGGRFAAVAQGLPGPHEVTDLATKLVVSGLRIDSPLLPGVELKFRVMVVNLKLSKPLSLVLAQAWLDRLTSRFQDWPSSHRSRSILMIKHHAGANEGFETSTHY